VMKAVEKDRSRRYDSARALADDLNHYLRHEPVSARSPSTGYRFGRFVRRNRVAVAAAAAVVAALVVGTAVSTVGFVRAQREAETAGRVSDFLSSIFAEADPSHSRGADVTVREMLDRAAGQIQTQLQGQPLVQGRLMLKIGEAYQALGLLDKAGPLLKEARNRLSRGGADALEMNDAEYEYAYFLTFRSDYAQAEPLMRHVWQARRKMLGDGDERTARALNNLVFIFLRSGTRYAEGDSMLRKALPVERAALGDDDEQVLVSMYHRCWALQGMGRMVEADSVCSATLEGRREVYGGDHPQIGYALLQLAHVRRSLGQYAASLEAAREALAMNRRLYHGDHPETSYALRTVAAALVGLGRPDSALAYAVQGEAMMRRVVDSTNTARSTSLLVLGDVLTDLRRFDGAEKAYREALAVDSGKFGMEYARVAQELEHLGMARMQQGQFGPAAAYGRRALSIVRRLPNPAPPVLLSALLFAGESSYRLGDLTRAEADLREALKRAKESPADHPLELATARVELARTLTDLGHTDEACPMAEAGLAERKAVLPPGHWRIGVAETVLGRCLTRAGKPALAQPHLRAGRRLLDAGRAAGDLYRQDAMPASRKEPAR
jgi:eukaryotic-like serine/threonine-protein kinase